MFEFLLGSPFTCKVTDTSQVLVSGSGLKSAAVNQQAIIMIDPQGEFFKHRLGQKFTEHELTFLYK